MNKTLKQINSAFLSLFIQYSYFIYTLDHNHLLYFTFLSEVLQNYNNLFLKFVSKMQFCDHIMWPCSMKENRK